jgi:hypothetical protein
VTADLKQHFKVITPTNVIFSMASNISLPYQYHLERLIAYNLFRQAFFHFLLKMLVGVFWPGV